MRRTVILLGALLGCAGTDTSTDGTSPPGACDAESCLDVAMRTPQGEPDGCDLSACVACASACGEQCAVQESYPPTYACGGQSWNVHDFCPAWSPAAGPRAEDVVDLGCGETGQALTATPDGPGRIAVTHVDYALGCCPQQVLVDVIATGTTLAISYALVGDDCECACELDASYALVDVPSGHWTVVAGAAGAFADVDVE